MSSGFGARIIFHSEAAKELREAKRWYRREARPEIRDAFMAEVDEATSRISKFPARWARYEDSYRFVQLTKFPYFIIYEPIESKQVLIVAVAYVRRRPGYWRERR